MKMVLCSSLVLLEREDCGKIPICLAKFKLLAQVLVLESLKM
jgi:hypothetical protein